MARSTHVLNELLREVAGSGFLAALPEGVAERLVAESIRINVPAGALIYREDERPHVIVVVSGVVRVFLSSADGRQVTVRYARAGDVAGLPLVLGGPWPMNIQAITAASVAALRVDTLHSLIATDLGVARACAEELTRQMQHLLDDLSDQAFLPVRQRLVRQLLDLASPGAGQHLVVRASHEELADAIASVRVVVTRTLRQLREEGLIAMSHDGIVLLDLPGLAEEAGAHGRRP